MKMRYIVVSFVLLFIAVVVTAILVRASVVRIDRHRELIADIKRDFMESREVVKNLTAEIDKLNKSVDERLVKIRSEVAARPVINIKYGTVLNTDGELVIKAGEMLAVPPGYKLLRSRKKKR